jgi:hypothetical protein
LDPKENTRSRDAYGVRKAGMVPSPGLKASSAPIAGGSSSSVSSSVAVAARPVKASKAPPTQEQIAVRARLIWEAKGRKPGQDKENWLEAEAQLKREAGLA